MVSRRSGGLSIGVNLNPDKACNFDCIYCQVDRSQPPKVREVDPTILGDELTTMIALASTGELYHDPFFDNVPSELRAIKDFAFSGDGEPTTCPLFAEAVAVVVKARQQADLTDTRIVLITDAAYLHKPNVQTALNLMDQNNGEVWAKLDAGTEAYYRQVNRPNVSLSHVLENIIATSRVRPIVIQSLFMRIDGRSPDSAELNAYADRLNDIHDAGGRVKCVQVYTIARPPTEQNVSALSDAQVDEVVALVRARTPWTAKPFYGT